jgi:hypothetical protein
LLIFFPRRQKLQIVPSQQAALPTEPRIESVQKHAVRYTAYRSLSLKSRHCLCQMLRQHGKRDVAVMLSSSSSRFSVANGRWMNRTGRSPIRTQIGRLPRAAGNGPGASCRSRFQMAQATARACLLLALLQIANNRGHTVRSNQQRAPTSGSDRLTPASTLHLWHCLELGKILFWNPPTTDVLYLPDYSTARLASGILLRCAPPTLHRLQQDGQTNFSHFLLAYPIQQSTLTFQQNWFLCTHDLCFTTELVFMYARSLFYKSSSRLVGLVA